MNLFFLFIVLLGFGIIYMLYYIFFPEGESFFQRGKEQRGKEQEKDFQQKIEKISAENEEVKKQLTEREEDFKNSLITIERLKQQEQKLTEDKCLIESNSRELSDKLKFLQDQSFVYEEKLKEKDSQIQKMLDKLKIKEQEVQKINDKLKEEKELFLKKEELEKGKEEKNSGLIRENEELVKKIEELNEQIEVLREKSQNLEFVKPESVQEPTVAAEGGQSVFEQEIILNDRQQALVDYLKENKKITRKEYTDKFNVSVPTAARDLKELQDKNLIKHHGSSGPGRYFILT